MNFMKRPAWPFPSCPACKRFFYRRVSATLRSSTSSLSRRWLRLTVVTATAAAAGAYIRWQKDQPSLNPFQFTQYTLVAKEPVSSTCSIFTLKPSSAYPIANIEVYEEAWNRGIWSVMFKQPQLQIGRDYTPLPPISSFQNGDDLDDDSLRFLIRRDAHGEVSRYLHGLEVGAVIELRGPKIECDIPSDTRDIVFIAGGTGIAPALQASHILLSRRNDSTPHRPRIHILWASRSREDCLGGSTDSPPEVSKAGFSLFSGLGCGFSRLGGAAAPASPTTECWKSRNGVMTPIVCELELLKTQFPGQITVDYFVDEEDTFIGKKSVAHCLGSSRLAEGSRHTKLILVSGPDGFVSYMAGPKIWAQGMELQGPLGGLLKELNSNSKGWSVWKL